VLKEVVLVKKNTLSMKIKSLLSILLIVNTLFSSGQIPEKTGAEAVRQSVYALELCRELHQHPELSFQEVNTSNRMAAELGELGFQVTRNFAGNSVVGVFRNGEGPVVMLRTDMDALPLEEKTGLEFASACRALNASGVEVPVMHACGHDIHMSVWVGTLRTLISLKKEWKGTLLVIAQQAEEVSGGSGKAIEEGLFTKFPVPACALAFHINPELPSGSVGVAGGPVFAGVKTVEITVRGKGGHGAYPEKCIDPVVIASRIVLDLQTIVSREISPLDPAVVTVGSIHGGTRPNIIPDEVKMELSLRYYSNPILEKLIASIRRISIAAAMAAGSPENKFPLVNVIPEITPPVINDPELAGKIEKFTSGVLGAGNVVHCKPAMVAEDFGKYGLTPEKIPICLMWLGCTQSERLKELEQKGEVPAPLHSPYLLPDYQKTIETGIRVMAGNVIDFMNSGKY
jgi:amidohydrolase